MLRRVRTFLGLEAIAYFVLILREDMEEVTSSNILPEPRPLNDSILEIGTLEIDESDNYRSCDDQLHEANEEEEAATSGHGSTVGARGQGAGRPSRVIRRGPQRRNRAPPATIGGGVSVDIQIVTEYFGSIGLKETMVGVVAYKFYPNKTLLSDLTLVSYAVAFAALFAGNSTKATWPRLSDVLTELGTDAAFAVVFGSIASHLPLCFGCVVFICWLVCAVCVRLLFSAAQSTHPPEPEPDSDSGSDSDSDA